MRNPFRSEAAAFRFLLWIACSGALVAVVEAAGGTRVAVLAAALVLAIFAVGYLRPGRPGRLLPSAPAHVGPPEERRVLLLVDEVPGELALEHIRGHADRLHVVSPARTTRLRRWLSDIDAAREDARERADKTVEWLHSAQLDADGVVGDENPLRALDDALREFGGDEIIVATADDDLAAHVRDRYAIPVSRV